VARLERQRRERHLQDPRVGLGEAAALRGHDHVEQRRESRGREAGSLDAVDSVGDDAQTVAAAQRDEGRPAARQPIAALAEPVEVGFAEPGRAPPVRADVAQQAAETLAREGPLGDLVPPEGSPQLGVDPLVGRQRGRRTRQAEREQGLLQGRALGPVEIEQRVVDVEENGAGTGQATSRGR
jgi:hypothetical protein